MSAQKTPPCPDRPCPSPAAHKCGDTHVASRTLVEQAVDQRVSQMVYIKAGSNARAGKHDTDKAPAVPVLLIAPAQLVVASRQGSRWRSSLISLCLWCQQPQHCQQQLGCTMFSCGRRPALPASVLVPTVTVLVAAPRPVAAPVAASLSFPSLPCVPPGSPPDRPAAQQRAA